MVAVVALLAGGFLYLYQPHRPAATHCQRVFVAAPAFNPDSPTGVSAIPVARVVCS